LASRPISDGLFTWPVPEPPGCPALYGARCSSCAALVFPVAPGCPRCGSGEMARVELPTSGTLYTWTTQEFLPKPPYLGPETAADFRPWAVGYVELGGELRVEGRLYDAEPARLSFGMVLEVVVRPFRTEPDGTEVWTYGFAPPGRQSPGQGQGVAREPG
jgi:uncharacterized OB-fold protein